MKNVETKFTQIKEFMEQSFTKKVPIKKVLFLCILLLYISTLRPLYGIISTGYLYAKNIDKIGKTFLDDFYPSELQIKIENGKVNTNVKEPYFISITPQQLSVLFNSEIKPTKRTIRMRLLAIDTKAKVEDFDKYQSYALLTGNSVVYLKDNRITVVPLNEVTQLTLTKKLLSEKFAEFTQAVDNNKAPITIGAVLFLFLLVHLMLFGMGFLMFFSILWLACVIWTLLKLNSINSSMGNALRAALLIMVCCWSIVYIPALLASYERSIYVNPIIFLIALSLAYVFIFKTKNTERKSRAFRIFVFLAHPAFIAIDIWKAKKSIPKKILYFIILLIILLIAWMPAIAQGNSTVQARLIEYGFINVPKTVPVSGTSMLPTIKNGDKITLNSPKKYLLERGDIISFHNDQTEGLYYLKRIIGIPGDKVLIKEGHVFINGSPISEPYVKYGPTYGNEFVIDCKTQTVPDHTYFVMGDNRIVSFDSRAIGYVDEKDIDGVVKVAQNQGATVDTYLMNSVPMQTEVFLQKYNEARTAEHIGELISNSTLNGIAQKKASSISSHITDRTDTFSVENELKKAGYGFTSVSEFITYGSLTEEQILNQIHEQYNAYFDFFSDTFTEIGLSQSKAQISECTIPVTVIIIARPDRPTYSETTAIYWQKELSLVKTSLNQSKTFISHPGMNQEKIEKLANIIEESYRIASEINRAITAREWIDPNMVERYYGLAKEANSLMEEIYEKGSIPQSFDPSSVIQTGNDLDCSYKGLVTIDNNVAAKIIRVWNHNNKIYARVSFSNDFSNKPATIDPNKILIRAREQSRFPESTYQTATLDVGYSVAYNLDYKELPDKPYDFIYKINNQEIQLARCQ